jgi:hypothetical protein
MGQTRQKTTGGVRLDERKGNGLQLREASNPNIWLQTGVTTIEFHCRRPDETEDHANGPENPRNGVLYFF